MVLISHLVVYGVRQCKRSLITVIRPCFDILTLLKIYLVIRLHNGKKSKNRIINYFAYSYKCNKAIIISGNTELTLRLQSKATLLKGTLAVITNAGFLFHFSLPGSQLVWGFKTAERPVLTLLCAVAGSLCNCRVCMHANFNRHYTFMHHFYFNGAFEFSVLPQYVFLETGLSKFGERKETLFDQITI